MKDDLISRQEAIDGKISIQRTNGVEIYSDEVVPIDYLKRLPSAQPEGYIKIPETGIDDLSDGFHTFRQLYYQRMMLFATIVKQNKDKAWKSLRHEDGELCFGGGWFIVGVDTPEGSYTYHYEDSFFSLFDCEELEYAKHWDGHTEKDVTRLLSLSSTQSKIGKWIRWYEVIEDDISIEYIPHCKCSECGTEYDSHSVNFINFCPNCGVNMRGEQEIGYENYKC